MRVLKFKVNKQIIIKNGEFENLIAGTKGYLKAQFEFSPEWSNMKKVVTFKTKDKEEYCLLKNNECNIPDDIAEYNSVAVFAEGRNDNERIITNGIEFTQTGGKE